MTRNVALAAVPLLVLALIGAGSPAGAQESTIVRAAPVQKSISDSDKSFDVQVLVDNVSNLGAFTVRLRFDDSVIRATAVAKTEFLGSSGREVVCSDPLVATDAVGLQCVTLRETPAGVDGSGALVTVTFEPVKAGRSDLALEVKLSTPQGNGIPATTEAGQVRVKGGDSRLWLRIAIGGAAAVVVLAVAAALIARRRTSRPVAGEGPHPL